MDSKSITSRILKRTTSKNKIRVDTQKSKSSTSTSSSSSVKLKVKSDLKSDIVINNTNLPSDLLVTPGAIDTAALNEQIIDNERGNWSKWNIRTRSTLIMLFSFGILISIGQIALWLLICLIQILMFKEIVKLGRVASQERQSPEQSNLQWYWFILAMYFMNIKTLISHFRNAEFIINIFPFIRYHNILTFLLYIVGIIIFVITLKKGYYKYQFSQFAWGHIALVMVVFTAHFAVKNLFNGLIWFVLPSILIVTNDIFAYIFGFFFGRMFIKAPLIHLSPKKTWEGFIGATLVTVISGFTLSRLFGNYEVFICPKADFSFGYANCVASPTFIPIPYELPHWIQIALSYLYIDAHQIWIAPIQFHGLLFAAFASIFAPFGGFFASGFKRAWKIKDFGDSIPGHGGMTDRMDCQLMLGFFVSVYYDTFIKHGLPSIDAVIFMWYRLTQEDQLAVFERMKENLLSRNLL